MILIDYMCQEKKGRWLISIEDSVDALIQRHEDYKENRRERLISATKINTDNARTNRTTITRKRWEEKQLLDVLND